MQNNIGQTEDARLSVPDGGIASFVPDDDEIDDVEDFGSQGIAQFPALAQRMAAMGRGGDDTLAHVQTGELIIPAALLAQDPAPVVTKITADLGFVQASGNSQVTTTSFG